MMLKHSLRVFLFVQLLSQFDIVLSDGEEQCLPGEEFDGSFIKTGASNFNWFSDQFKPCFKRKFINRFEDTLSSLKRCYSEGNITGSKDSCIHLINNYTQIQYLTHGRFHLWYPAILNTRAAKDVQRIEILFNRCNRYIENLEMEVFKAQNFTNCTGISTDLRYTLMPFLPWKCQIDKDLYNKADLLVQLYAIEKTLPRNCGDVVCSVTKKLHNIPILRFNESKDQTCMKTLNDINHGPSCHTKNEGFCFHVLKRPRSDQSIVFITKDTETISDNEKIVYILRNFTNLQSTGWCHHPLDYTEKVTHYKNIYTYFFCYSNSSNNAKESWSIKDVTRTESLVALNANVSTAIIKSNVILQRLLFHKTSISTAVYNDIINLNYTFRHYTDEFHIPVFHGNNTNFRVLDDIKQGGHNIFLTRTKYFTRLEDHISIWSPLNWIIFHGCSQKYKDDKDLFLFLYNGSFDLDHICHPDTSVLLTSLRRENVTLLNSRDFRRDCFDRAINKETDRECQATLNNSIDYETRFFHFLVYPNNLDKKSVVKLLSQKMKNLNETEIFYKTFYQGSHPEVLGGLTKIDDGETDASEFGNRNDDNSHMQSLQKTLDIFIMANLSNNEKCLKSIEDGDFMIEVISHFSENGRVQPHYVIGPILSDITDASCLTILPFDIYMDLLNIQKEKKLTVNKFWSTCKHNALIAWHVDTNDTIVLEWDYLSTLCKASETSLFILCCVITSITIFGNITVITIMIFSKLIKKNIYKVYTSIAIADLLLGVTSAPLALHDTHYLRTGRLTIYDLSKAGPWAPFGTLAHEQPAGFQQTRFPRYGWPAMCAIAMNISILSSLMCLALLGTERFLMFLSMLPSNEIERNENDAEGHNSTVNNNSQNAIQSKGNIRLNDIRCSENQTHSCTELHNHLTENNDATQNNPQSAQISNRPWYKRLRMPSDESSYVTMVIIIIWIWNIISAFVINAGTSVENSYDYHTHSGINFVGFFDPITKLTLNTGGGSSGSLLSQVVFYIQIIIASLAGIIIVTATVASAIIFKILQSNMQKTDIRIHHSDREKQAHSVTLTFVMMVVFFLISSAPIAISILINSLIVNISDTIPGFHFFAWWLFMAMSSWNWIIYVYRGQQFRTEANKIKEWFWG